MSNPHADRRRRLCWANCNNSSCPKLSLLLHPDCNLLTSPASSEHASVSPCPAPTMPLASCSSKLPLTHSKLLQGPAGTWLPSLPSYYSCSLPSRPSARLAAINRSVLINLLIIDAIMCFICGTTRGNVRCPTGAWGHIKPHSSEPETFGQRRPYPLLTHCCCSICSVFHCLYRCRCQCDAMSRS